MPEERPRVLVTNTTPLIALTAATGGLDVLPTLYDRVVVPFEVAAGRRVARLCELTVTGSIGILIKARSQGFPLDMPAALERMRRHGIWLSERVVRFALSH